MKTTFHAYFDPGHGWCKVPCDILKSLGILERISDYSYLSKDGNNAFLEENCDYGIFCDAYVRKFNKKPKIIYHYADKSSKIRNYKSFVTMKKIS